jgi:glucose/arabinose dehydrogenase
VDEDGTPFASWTRPDLRLVVAALEDGKQRPVWLGPKSTDIATGGHIAFAPDGSLVIGIGDLEDPGSVSDSKAPNGKLLRLDPDGKPGQRWKSISYGWNNPYAFAYAPDGGLWLADNAPGNDRERLLRADPVGPQTWLPDRTAPSGLAVVDDDTLVVCGYRTKLLLRFRIAPNRSAQPDGPPLARDCRLGVVRLEDGRIAYSTDDSIRFLRID